MSISFSQLPANWKLPLTWIEVDSSQAGTVSDRIPALLIGQMLASGNATPDQPVAVSSLIQAQALFGVGSMLSRMFNAFQTVNSGAILYCLPVVEPAGGTAAAGVIAYTSPPTASGTLTHYIAGQKISVGVASTDLASDVAAKVTTAINALTTLPVTAVQGTSANVHKVTLTCKWKGLTGNDITMSDNYYGAMGGEQLPTGLVISYTAMTGGAGAPTLTNAIAAMGDDIYDYCGFPFTDSTSLNAIEAEYGLGDNGRWGVFRGVYGTVFTAKRDTYANLMTYGATGNAPVSSVMAVEVGSPTPIWEWAAAYAGRAARAFLNDPARPLQTLTFDGCLPAKRGSRFSLTERNNLASTGIATQRPNGNDVPMIEAEVSRYRVNALGQGDTAYQYITTLHTLAAIFRRLKQAISSKYPRHKLAQDGTRFGAGQAILTPKIIKAELIAEYSLMIRDGLTENMEAFKANTFVEINGSNPNRADVMYTPDLVNQLRVFGVLAQFRLNFQQAA